MNVAGLALSPRARHASRVPSVRLLSAALVITLAAAIDVRALTYPVTNTNDTGIGSLRAAITAANNNAGPDIIEFNIAGSGTRVIVPATQLPAITDEVHIDGTTQPGFNPRSGDPVVELDGHNAIAVGLFVQGSSAKGSTIEALRIVRFDNNTEGSCGIRVAADDVTIVGNYIGTNGSAALGKWKWYSRHGEFCANRRRGAR